MIRRALVRFFYADHNDSPMVRRKLAAIVAGGERVLNFGSGYTRLAPNVVNLDLAPDVNVDVVYDGRNIPFPDGHFDAVVSQEVLEHVEDIEYSLVEIARVLKPGGLFYCQMPFILGYHSGPEDYRRFTHIGMQDFFTRRGWQVQDWGVTVGAAVALYRIAVEFFAVLLSAPLPRIYKPMKGLFAVLLFPLKWLDPLTRGGANRHRVAGGFYVVVAK